MANHIRFRRVEVREPVEGGGFRTKEVRLQYQTRDIVSAVFGLLPLASTWSEWTDFQEEVVLLDQNGNPSD